MSEHFNVGAPLHTPPDSINRMTMQLVATAECEVIYGELRLAVAAWAGIDPGDVTPELVTEYEQKELGQ